MARFAVEQNLSLVRGFGLEGIETDSDGEVRCLLRDSRQRQWELLLSFASASSSAVTRLCARPVLPTEVEVRPLQPADAAELRRLELAAPVRRDDGTEVVIDHVGTQFDHQALVRDHRLLAAFGNGRMLAVQGLAATDTSIAGAPCRIAYAHYSRSDPTTRSSGYLFHLVATLFRDVYPRIDQFVSVVDVHNSTGLRLSFGSPWPTRIRRLFLPVRALAARAGEPSEHATFDAAHAAALLNATHDGMNLWVRRTPAFLVERQRRAPSVYGAGCWRLTDHAALAIWASGERRTYRREGAETVRTLALVLDYGFTGSEGRDELTALLCRAAAEVADRGISHLALFVSDGHAATQWLADLADGSDTYAICAPPLERPAPPSGPVYCDQVLF